MNCEYCQLYATFALRFNHGPLEFLCDTHYVSCVMEGISEGYISPEGGVMETIIIDGYGLGPHKSAPAPLRLWTESILSVPIA